MITPFLWTVSGSCCNLRKHVCELHNRGLNNKCYDSCMCEEGEQMNWFLSELIITHADKVEIIF